MMKLSLNVYYNQKSIIYSNQLLSVLLQSFLLVRCTTDTLNSCLFKSNRLNTISIKNIRKGFDLTTVKSRLYKGSEFRGHVDRKNRDACRTDDTRGLSRSVYSSRLPDEMQDEKKEQFHYYYISSQIEICARGNVESKTTHGSFLRIVKVVIYSQLYSYASYYIILFTIAL